MRKLGWLALQISVVAFAVWVDWGVSHSGDPRAMPGVITGFGIFMAFFFTLWFSEVWDSIIIARNRARTRDVAKPVHHRDRLSAATRQSGQPPEALRRLR